MEEDKFSHKTVKKKWLNPYLNNYAKFRWWLFFSSMLAVTNTIFTSIIFIINFLESGDYFYASGKVEEIYIAVGKYLYTGLLSSFNHLNQLNDILGTNFNYDIQVIKPNIFLIGWILIGLSIIISYIFHHMVFYQYYIQKRLKTSSFHSYYVPFILLHTFTYRKYTNKVYIRSIEEIKPEKITKNDHNLLLQNLFDIEMDDVEEYTIKIKSTRKFYLFDYFILHLVRLQKDTNGKTNSQEKVHKNTRQSHNKTKEANTSKEPQGFYS